MVKFASHEAAEAWFFIYKATGKSAATYKQPCLSISTTIIDGAPTRIYCI